MEIHHQSVPEPRPSQGSKDWPRVDVTRGNRASIQRATEKVLEEQRAAASEVDRESATEAAARKEAARAAATESSAQGDRLELSQEAQRLAEQVNLQSEPTEAELERVRELRAQYESGELNTYERVQRAAERMLGGS
jgi:anti-sigma28 factor (negative regulator of flagellin synthesis)